MNNCFLPPKQIRWDIDLIRLYLIISLVIYHSFAPFTGDWENLYSTTSSLYRWIGMYAYSFMLETFVFISGLLFGIQILNSSNYYPFKIILKKLKRLVIPSVLWSSVYYFLYKDINLPIETIVYRIFNGVGHMWFLPMLFWCFMFTLVIERMKIGRKYIVCILLLCSCCSGVGLPFQLGKTMYYLFFFYIGYLLGKKELNFPWGNKGNIVLYSVCLFNISFIVLTLFRNYYTSIIFDSYSFTFISKICLLIINNCTKLCYSVIGVYMIYIIAQKTIQIFNIFNKKWGGGCIY